MRSSQQRVCRLVGRQRFKVMEKVRIPLQLVTRKKLCCVLFCHSGRFHRSGSFVIAHLLGGTIRSLCLMRVCLLLSFPLRLESQVRTLFCKYLEFSFALHEGCFFIVFRDWSRVLRFRVLQTCMDYYFSVRLGLALAGSCCVVNSIRNKEIYIGFPM